uniref:Uncharacterized protein n=1 Tax=Spermophilus dauricus TaxID=99837 RepID=A0A8C9Q5Q1_SPEDA
INLCCFSNYENNLLLPELPLPCCNHVACAVARYRMAASPLHSHWTHASPGWFWFFFFFFFFLQGFEGGGCLFVCFFSRVWKVYSAERL